MRTCGVRVRYMHHDIDTIERMEIIRDLRLGEFDVLVGINLLREGLDIPEVSLVAILDADKEGFLRSETSLVQTIGRAARNADGKVIMYADSVTRFDGARHQRDRTAAARFSRPTTRSTASCRRPSRRMCGKFWKFPPRSTPKSWVKASKRMSQTELAAHHRKADRRDEERRADSGV